MAKKHYIIPVFVPFAACPHKCIFCEQENITGVKSRETDVDVSAIITEYLDTILVKQEDKYIEVGYYGGSFTGLPLATQRKLLAPAGALLAQGIINGIRLSTRPDYINKEILDLLRENKVSTVELGVQSLHDEVLALAKRGHTVSQVQEAVTLIKQAGFKLGIQLMVGLPGDTPDKSVASAKATVALKPDFVRIYPAIVLASTELATMYQQGKYQPWSLDVTVQVIKDMTYAFNVNNIPIIRIGLQDTELLKEHSYLAGPYHPAIGELVKAAVFLDFIQYLINLNKYYKKSKIALYCAKADESKVRGHKNNNLLTLADKYPGLEILIKPSLDIPPDQLGISEDCEHFPEKLFTKQEFIGLRRI